MTDRAPKYWAIVPAAGIGQRFSADVPKQFHQLNGALVAQHTLSRLLSLSIIDAIVAPCEVGSGYWSKVPAAADPRVRLVAGGKQRADSVMNGLLALQESAADHDWVLVHDAARPNLTPADLDRLLDSLADDPVGGLLAVPVRDTLKRIGSDGRVAETVDRSVIWQAYTPQMFRLGALREALAQALEEGVAVTDEASAMEWAGQSPRLIEGRADNLKVTRPEDLHYLQRIWRESR